MPFNYRNYEKLVHESLTDNINFCHGKLGSYGLNVSSAALKNDPNALNWHTSVCKWPIWRIRRLTLS